ncbi:hypothetical protein BGW42_002027 [Actinomortierella wolfii]|nr:hypothetical protein BGW42_002027 [Actinomortierella wolfii]KAG0243724.1 hypothetical protein BGW41_001597 [Actinomortierella wolfii]
MANNTLRWALCLLTVLSILPSVFGLYFYLEGSEQKCFTEELPRETLVTGEFKAEEWDDKTQKFIANPKLGLEVIVEEMPSGNRIFNQKMAKTQGNFHFTTAESGEHAICLFTSTSGWSTSDWFATSKTRVHLDLSIKDVLDEDTEASAESLSDLAQRIRELTHRVAEIRREQIILREHEEEFRNKSEAVNSHTVTWTLAQLVVLAVTCAWQMRHLKGFFEAKKLYDVSVSTYSPDGRVFQVEYAGKAVENSGTVIGLRVKDGVVLAVEKLIQSKLLVPGSNRRIQNVDRHIGIATAGLLADGRHIVKRAREEAQGWRDIYKQPIDGPNIASRVGDYIAAYTLYSSVRPFGVSTVIGAMDKTGPKLYMIEPSGLYWGYHGIAVGKGRQVAKTEIEKLNLAEMTCREAVKHAARIIHEVHDEAKDKEFELEVSWVCEESGGFHQMVPKDLVEEAEQLAKAANDDDMDDD